HGHIEGRGVAHVVAVRLERSAQYRDLLAEDAASEPIHHELHGAVAAPQVDCVHLAQEGHRLAYPQLFRPRGERTDVLRQAPAAESDAGTEELASDARIVTDRVGELRDVGTRRL